jgi:hypothetical protein
MADMTTTQKMDHFEVEKLKDDAYPQHGMTGFDTTEDQLPPGYFRSSFFIGTMLVVMIAGCPGWFSDVATGSPQLWVSWLALQDLVRNIGL